jgi:hypothetical protein
MLFDWLKRSSANKVLTRGNKLRQNRLHLELLEDRWCPSSLAPPHITANPANLTADAGHKATFTAAASGSQLNVQWKVSRDAGRHFTDILGATSATLTINATAGDNGAEYEAVFTNKAGRAVTTAATLTVDTAPVITKQPLNHRVTAGSQVTLTAAARSNPSATVQWQVSTDRGLTFSNVAGATSTTLTVRTPLSGGVFEYRAVFTNALGTATTRAAVVRAKAPPVVTANPANLTVSPGQNVSFTASASGTPSPHVQWQVSTDGGKHFHNIAGATANVLSFAATASETGCLYRAVFTNRLGKATTSAATLTVAAGSAPVITTQPTDQNVTTLSTVTLTADASSSPTATVQWQMSNDGGQTFTDIVGATSTTLTFAAAAPGVLQYRAIFANPLGSATTNVATVTVTGGQIIAV